MGSLVPDVITLAQQLSGVSFATLLVVILFGSYRGWWVWGRQLSELRSDLATIKAEFERRLQKQEASIEMWQAMALRATGLAEDTVFIAKRKGPHDVP